MSGLTFTPTRWVVPTTGPAEETQTTAFLKVTLGDSVVTRIEDEASRSIAEDVLVSLYPLALWIAASWWRLLWEPSPSSRPSVDWLMAHSTATAGHGYVWPRIFFESDGEVVVVRADPTRARSKIDPVHYLTYATQNMSRDSVEIALKGFIELVCARLDAVGLSATQLHSLWSEVSQERLDGQSTLMRRREARLGYEPDEAPADLLTRLVQLSQQAGERAVDELAALNSRHGHWLTQMVDAAQHPVATGRLEVPRLPVAGAGSPPWDQGYKLARLLRGTSGLDASAMIPDQRLTDALGLPNAFLRDGSKSLKVGASLAIRDGTQTRFVFRRKAHRARRFEAARMIGDALVERTEAWLPGTDSTTARQKRQRAFAAEFLAPINAITDRLGDDFSDEAIDEVASDFDVPPLVISSQLANHGHIQPSQVPSFWAT